MSGGFEVSEFLVDMVCGTRPLLEFPSVCRSVSADGLDSAFSWLESGSSLLVGGVSDVRSSEGALNLTRQFDDVTPTPGQDHPSMHASPSVEVTTARPPIPTATPSETPTPTATVTATVTAQPSSESAWSDEAVGAVLIALTVLVLLVAVGVVGAWGVRRG